jgi:hypothetical protein
MTTRAIQNTAKSNPVSNLIAYDHWLVEVGISSATGWRWRRDGLITTVNILGRVYVSRDAVEAFERRAAAGDFAKAHTTPRKKPHPAEGAANGGGR